MGAKIVNQNLIQLTVNLTGVGGYVSGTMGDKHYDEVITSLVVPRQRVVPSAAFSRPIDLAMITLKISSMGRVEDLIELTCYGWWIVCSFFWSRFDLELATLCNFQFTSRIRTLLWHQVWAKPHNLTTAARIVERFAKQTKSLCGCLFKWHGTCVPFPSVFTLQFLVLSHLELTKYSTPTHLFLYNLLFLLFKKVNTVSLKYVSRLKIGW